MTGPGWIPQSVILSDGADGLVEHFHVKKAKNQSHNLPVSETGFTYISGHKSVFLVVQSFKLSWVGHIAFLCMLWDGSRYLVQSGWIFGKVPKGGGGVIYNPKIYIADFCHHKRYLGHEFFRKFIRCVGVTHPFPRRWRLSDCFPDEVFSDEEELQHREEDSLRADSRARLFVWTTLWLRTWKLLEKQHKFGDKMESKEKQLLMWMHFQTEFCQIAFEEKTKEKKLASSVDAISKSETIIDWPTDPKEIF